jgi:hypothetical protein
MPETPSVAPSEAAAASRGYECSQIFGPLPMTNFWLPGTPPAFPLPDMKSKYGERVDASDTACACGVSIDAAKDQ